MVECHDDFDADDVTVEKNYGGVWPRRWRGRSPSGCITVRSAIEPDPSQSPRPTPPAQTRFLSPLKWNAPRDVFEMSEVENRAGTVVPAEQCGVAVASLIPSLRSQVIPHSIGLFLRLLHLQ